MSELLATFRLLAGASPWAALLIYVVWAWVGIWLAGQVAHYVLARVSSPFPFLHRLLDYAFPSGRMVVFFLMLQPVLRNLPPERMPVELLKDFNSLLLSITLTWVLVRIVAAARDAILAAHPVDSPNNLAARRVHTQTRVLTRTVTALIILVGIGLALMTFPALNRLGTSLLAAGGLAGVAVGFAAKPIFTNLLAGLQIALTQPIRLDDVVIVQGEWGRIGEITDTYVVIHLWDQRRLVVPLTWFIENPFQNWTRHNAELLAFVLLWLDYRTPIEVLRTEAIRLCQQAPEWDGRLVEVQVVDASAQAMQVRVLMSAANADMAWHLRARIREQMIAFVQREYPDCLPRTRAEAEVTQRPPG